MMCLFFYNLFFGWLIDFLNWLNFKYLRRFFRGFKVLKWLSDGCVRDSIVKWKNSGNEFGVERDFCD